MFRYQWTSDLPFILGLFVGVCAFAVLLTVAITTLQERINTFEHQCNNAGGVPVHVGRNNKMMCFDPDAIVFLQEEKP